MRTRLIGYLAALVLFLGLLATTADARQPKRYQVTGNVVELTDDLIVVDKDGEKWELARTSDTKVTGKLKVGEKVTVEYRMAANTVEVKDKDKK